MSFPSLCLQRDREMKVTWSLPAIVYRPFVEQCERRGRMDRLWCRLFPFPSTNTERSKTAEVHCESRRCHWWTDVQFPALADVPRQRRPWKRRSKVAPHVRELAKRHEHRRMRAGPPQT